MEFESEVDEATRSALRAALAGPSPRSVSRLCGPVFQVEEDCTLLRVSSAADAARIDAAEAAAAATSSEVPTWTKYQSAGSRVDTLTGGPYVTLEGCFARENAVAALQSPGSSSKRNTESSAALGRVLAAVYGQGGAFERSLGSRKRPLKLDKEDLLGQLAALQEEVMGSAGVFEDSFFSATDRDQLKAELVEALANLDSKMRETELSLEEVPGVLSVFNSVVDTHGETMLVALQRGRCLFADDALGAALSLVLSRTSFALSPHDALRLPASSLAAQLGCTVAQAEVLRAELAAHKVGVAFGRGARLATTAKECDAVVADGARLCTALVSSVLRSRLDVPLVEAEALKTLRTGAMRQAATTYNEIATRARARMEMSIRPWRSLFALCVACARLALQPPSHCGSRQAMLAGRCVVILAKGCRSALQLEAQDVQWSAPSPTATVPAVKPWDSPNFVDEERERLKSVVAKEHGTILNPVTGEALDIMQQCVALRIEARDCELVDAQAFDEVLSAFGARLRIDQKVWVNNTNQKSGTVHRVNDDSTLDVMLTTADSNNKVLRDVPRRDVASEPLLVVGEPAGGKTTFAKQLMTWTMRQPRHSRLVPVLVRVCDVSRFFRRGCADDLCLVWEFLRQTTPELQSKLYDKAREERRLLLILDGFDEAGALHERLEKEINEVYQHQPFVLTSREMKSLSRILSTSTRFRKVRVLQLDKAQIRAVAERRLGSLAVDFLEVLRRNASLERMSVNPLLLSVTLAVFSKNTSGLAINRGLVYSMALDSMLENASSLNSSESARKLLRRVAWLAHSSEGGRGLRDWDEEIVQRALLELKGDTGITQQDWEIISSLAQRGRLPLLAWFSERGQDKYRFAHLTFQEFLCAEHCYETFQLGGSDDLAFAAELQSLVLRGSGPSQVFVLGWWQQVLQMFADICRSREATHYSALVGRRMLGLSDEEEEEHGVVALDACVGERNAATLVALLADNSVGTLKVTQGEVGFLACELLAAEKVLGGSRLRHLDLSGNLVDGRAATVLATAIYRAGSACFETLDLSHNRICVGLAKRPGFEKETFHSRNRGGSKKAKLYADYMHAAWMPDLEGISALCHLAKATPTMRTLDVRSNALTYEAGELLAALIDDSRLTTICGVEVHSLPDVIQMDTALRVGERVEARFHAQNVFYPAIVVAISHASSDNFDVAYVDEQGGLIREEPNVPRALIRARARDSRRLETGGCLVLATALERCTTPVCSLKLAQQGLAFDMGVFNPERAEGQGETGMNPRAMLRLILALKKFNNLDMVDVRDSLDSGAIVGAALGKAALECKWKLLGVGACLIDVEKMSQSTQAKMKRSLKDCGLAAVTAIAQAAESIHVSTTAVSSEGLGHLIRAANVRPHLMRINALELARFDDFTLTTLDLSSANLNRTLARLVLRFIQEFPARMPLLTELDLSNSDLMPSEHPHPMTPEIFGNGHLCNACATHHPLTVDLNLACQICDNDSCGGAWRSSDIVDELALALKARTERLESLTLRNCCFTTMDGPISVKPFERLGDALLGLEKLKTLDLSENKWSNPRLTRWCAESMRAEAVEEAKREDDEDDTLRRPRNRIWNNAAQEISEDENSEPDEREHENAYSRMRIPVAQGFKPLAKAIAGCTSLQRVSVADDHRVVIDLATLTSASLSSTELFPEMDLATLVLFTDLLATMARRGMIHSVSINLDLPKLKSSCYGAAQEAVAGLLAVPELQIEQLQLAPNCTLKVADLKSGLAQELVLAKSSNEEARACGLVVAAAVDAAMCLRRVDVRGMDFGWEASRGIVDAAWQHKATLVSVNGLEIIRGQLETSTKSLALDGLMMDTGGYALARFGLITSRLESLDLADSKLSPEAVSSLLTAVLEERAPLRYLSLARNDLGEIGTKKLAHYLRSDATLLTLNLRGSKLPRSMTAAMDALALAVQSNATLVEIDLRETPVPARLARALKRTFLEKRPTSPLRLDSKLQLLLILRQRLNSGISDDSLAVVFSYARSKRVLKLDEKSPEALADLYAITSPIARDLVDRLESQELDITSEEDLEEINAIVVTLDENDRRSVIRAYRVQHRRMATAAQAAAQAGGAEPDSDDEDDGTLGEEDDDDDDEEDEEDEDEEDDDDEEFIFEN